MLPTEVRNAHNQRTPRLEHSRNLGDRQAWRMDMLQDLMKYDGVISARWNLWHVGQISDPSWAIPRLWRDIHALTDGSFLNYFSPCPSAASSVED